MCKQIFCRSNFSKKTIVFESIYRGDSNSFYRLYNGHILLGLLFFSNTTELFRFKNIVRRDLIKTLLYLFIIFGCRYNIFVAASSESNTRNYSLFHFVDSVMYAADLVIANHLRSFGTGLVGNMMRSIKFVQLRKR